ncbi:hypothetical protein HYR99_08620, partial [Candidatus Poribacteria bacterium]|nr:hypothetical protein [Candidatus Poribacteria bacterium]
MANFRRVVLEILIKRWQEARENRNPRLVANIRRHGGNLPLEPNLESNRIGVIGVPLRWVI